MTAARPRVRRWLSSVWAFMPEPREQAAAWTLIYSVALATGFVTLLFPPVSIAAKIGAASMSAVGALLVAGAVAAMCGGAFKNGRLERIGIAAQAWALAIYGVVVLVLHVQGPGSRLTQAGVIVLAFLGCCVVRWLMLWRHERELKTLGG